MRRSSWASSARRAGLAGSLAIVLLFLAPVPAAADWYFTPFIGIKFGGSTTLASPLVQIEVARKAALGGSVALISNGLLGVEADYGFYPGLFVQADDELVVASNRAQTLTGSVLLAAPLGLTRESLRPYLVGGVGWMSVIGSDEFVFFPVDEDFIALNLGVGAIGMLGDRFGLRFDVRHFSNLDRDEPSDGSSESPRLKFWRGTVGVTLRY